MGDRPLEFYRRFIGHEPDRGMCTSQLEMTADRRWLVMRLASVSKYALMLDRDDVVALADALVERRPETIRVRHERLGERRLSVDSCAPKVGLSFDGEDRIELVFDDAQAESLVSGLRASVDQLRRPLMQRC
ncbi:hypothetical protein D5S17_11870 [Pseudonocardiaceae bacterium YIM PH 21723]|nr:hypothetical protein D5S17_11870 [Pseudonocardiaceae bacterium YIM PH 21723]